MNLTSKQGTVYVEGKKLEGRAAAKAIEDAYAAYIKRLLLAGDALEVAGRRRKSQVFWQEAA